MVRYIHDGGLDRSIYVCINGVVKAWYYCVGEGARGVNGNGEALMIFVAAVLG